VLNITAPNGFINQGETKVRVTKLIKKFGGMVKKKAG
jgi:hypothetical protein